MVVAIMVIQIGKASLLFIHKSVRYSLLLILGYCSQCYRNYMEKERHKKEQDFSKFEEKKRQQTDKKKSFKNVFKISSNAKGMCNQYILNICVKIY